MYTRNQLWRRFAHISNAKQGVERKWLNIPTRPAFQNTLMHQVTSLGRQKLFQPKKQVYDDGSNE